jgi:ribonuclease HII
MASQKPWECLEESIIIGIDEAGRGCLAGAVYAGAVILNVNAKSKKLAKEIRDSKLISEPRREILFNQIIEEHRCGIGIATVEEITRFNILNAALLAMRRAFDNLKLSAEELLDCHVLVDGDQRIREFHYPQTPVVMGDQKVKAISAASIVAKVSRDRELRKMHEQFPHYGFAEHKGYATEGHRDAIAKHGPCEHHRPTFAGVREYIPVEGPAAGL